MGAKGGALRPWFCPLNWLPRNDWKCNSKNIDGASFLRPEMNYYLVGGCPSFHCRSQKTGPINIFRVAFRAPRLFLAQPPFCSHSAQAAAQDPETRGAGAGSRFVGVRLLVGARQCGLTVTAMRWQSLRDSTRQPAALTVTAMRWQWL